MDAHSRLRLDRRLAGTRRSQVARRRRRAATELHGYEQCAVRRCFPRMQQPGRPPIACRKARARRPPSVSRALRGRRLCAGHQKCPKSTIRALWPEPRYRVSRRAVSALALRDERRVGLAGDLERVVAGEDRAASVELASRVDATLAGERGAADALSHALTPTAVIPLPVMPRRPTSHKLPPRRRSRSRSCPAGFDGPRARACDATHGRQPCGSGAPRAQAAEQRRDEARQGARPVLIRLLPTGHAVESPDQRVSASREPRENPR
jgi:hypothetical protein